MKLRHSVRLQIKALNKNIPYGHQWTTAFLFDGRKFFYDRHTSYLRIAFANTFVKTFGKWTYTKWWQQNYYFKFKSILLM